MPTVVIDGITTRYDVVGSGPPVLMFAPGGFDATIEKWTTQGIYTKIRPVEHLSTDYRSIVFDRRESGGSGGRVEAISWAHSAAQGKEMMRLDIPALLVPGRDTSHATSAARFLEECLPRAEYWDVTVESQTDATVPRRLLEFLDRQAVSA
ncbi:MAG: hypothetical protein HYU37_20490 [Acidobacteria bacterium]|nr:hypothetical protein [Acidobacteriota bacterium]